MQVLHFADDIALEIKYFQVATELTNQLNLLDALLVQGDLLQGGQYSLVMLGPLGIATLRQ